MGFVEIKMTKSLSAFYLSMLAVFGALSHANADVCLSAGGDCPTIAASADGSGGGAAVPPFPQIDNAAIYNSTLQQSLRAPTVTNSRGPQMTVAAPGITATGSCDSPSGELQRYLCQTADRYLPIYGLNMFRQGGNAFVQQDAVAVAPDYPIGVGDSFSVRIWGQLDADLQLTVDRSGTIFIPRVGAISVVGVPFGALKQYLSHEIGKVFRNFDLAITMGTLKTLQVFVVGFVQQPGSVSLNSLSTIMNALYAAGGPSATGSLRRVQLKRGNQVVKEFDLYDLLLKGDKSNDVLLQAGDVIYVPTAGPQVAIRGPVRVPAIYEIKGRETLQQLIDMAGGAGSATLEGNISVERISPDKGRIVETTALGKAEKYPLRGGDIVQLYRISNKIDQLVSLRGNVAQPLRQAWRDGMHVSDLIVSRDMLLAPEFWTVRSQRNQKAEARSDEKIRRTLTTDDNEVNWDYAAIERLDPVMFTTRLISFNLAAAIGKDPQQDLLLQAGDVVHVFSKADIQVASTNHARYVKVEGEVAVPGIYETKSGETLEQLISRIGGVTPRAYLYAAQFSREAVRQKQQDELDKMLDAMTEDAQRDAADLTATAFDATDARAAAGQQTANQRLISKLRRQKATGRVVLGMAPDARDTHALPDMELEDGDTVYIPPKPATVAIVGAVYNRNTAFVFDSHKTIGDYMQLAGAPTAAADDDQIYVVRADGSIVSERQGGIFSGVKHLAALPGDTIIVPEKIDHTTFVKSVMDWTQILANFATGAAAIKVLGN